MSIKILALSATALLSGTVAAQQTLYNNPFDPSGSNDCGFSSGCQVPGTKSDAQLFTLGNAATVQSVSFTAIDPRANPENSYEWAIYSAVGGVPGGSAVFSGQVFRPGSGQADIYSELNIGTSA